MHLLYKLIIILCFLSKVNRLAPRRVPRLIQVGAGKEKSRGRRATRDFVREFAQSDKLPTGKDGAMFRIPLVVSCQASRSWSHLVLIHQIVHSIMRAAIPIARNTQCVFVLCSMKYEAQKKKKQDICPAFLFW